MRTGRRHWSAHLCVVVKVRMGNQDAEKRRIGTVNASKGREMRAIVALCVER